MFCREQAAHYEREQGAFEALGVNLVTIGNGTPAMAREFVEQFGISFAVYTDPDRTTYRTLGMSYGAGFKLATLKHGFRALRGGHLQGATKGRNIQQGGLVVVGTDGEILYAYRESGPGEHLPTADVLKTLRALL